VPDNDEPALDTVQWPDAYERLRRIARRLMSRERAGHTLSPTDVVHEALARLMAGESAPRGLSLLELTRRASRAMTEVLIDHARRRGAIKRGGGRRRVGLDEIEDAEVALDADNFDWLALHGALEEMARVDPRRHQVVLLHFFAGLNDQQIAAELKVDPRTVRRDWAASKLWLRKQLSGRDTDIGD
jgi:RNA polymerase sigma factor (TIGR02999 family)